MTPTLGQAVLIELGASGPVHAELRALAKDRSRSAERALAIVANVRPLGPFARKVAVLVAAIVRQEHAAGVRVR